jgi:hypothetical protein
MRRIEELLPASFLRLHLPLSCRGGKIIENRGHEMETAGVISTLDVYDATGWEKKSLRWRRGQNMISVP